MRLKRVFQIVILLGLLGYLSYRLRLGSDVFSCSAANELSCWIDQVQAAVKDGGIDTGFVTFATLYDQEPAFESRCHDVAHYLGEAAYGQFSGSNTVALRPEAAYCGYGFYHGFLTALIREHPGDLVPARVFCDAAGKDEGSLLLPCYHGLGHASFDAVPESLWGDERAMVSRAVAMCHTLTDEPFKLRMCGNGVFNSLRMAYGKGEYRIWLQSSDAFSLCREQENLFAQPCYGEMALALLNDSGQSASSDFGNAVRIIHSIDEPEGAAEALSYIAADAARGTVDAPDYGEFARVCQSFSGELRTVCIEGIVQGLLMVGKPREEYQKPLVFCQTPEFSPDDTRVCISRVFDYTTKVYDREKVERICQLTDQTYCRGDGL